MVVLTCAALLAVAILLTATLTASILLGLVTGSLAAVTLQGTRELAVRARKPRKPVRIAMPAPSPALGERKEITAPSS